LTQSTQNVQNNIYDENLYVQPNKAAMLTQVPEFYPCKTTESQPLLKRTDLNVNAKAFKPTLGKRKLPADERAAFEKSFEEPRVLKITHQAPVTNEHELPKIDAPMMPATHSLVIDEVLEQTVCPSTAKSADRKNLPV
jgi:hypothetical protein